MYIFKHLQMSYEFVWWLFIFRVDWGVLMLNSYAVTAKEKLIDSVFLIGEIPTILK